MTDDNKEITIELEDALKKAEENLRGWQRAVADFENYKRRDEQFHVELVSFGEEKVISQLLGILEDLDRVFAHIPEDSKDLAEWKKGVEGVRKRAHDSLHDLGVERIGTVGEKFNPDWHEALAQIEGKEENTVAEEVSPGYKRKDKVLKPAKVKVYKSRNN